MQQLSTVPGPLLAALTTNYHHHHRRCAHRRQHRGAIHNPPHGATITILETRAKIKQPTLVSFSLSPTNGSAGGSPFLIINPPLPIHPFLNALVRLINTSFAFCADLCFVCVVCLLCLGPNSQPATLPNVTYRRTKPIAASHTFGLPRCLSLLLTLHPTFSSPPLSLDVGGPRALLFFRNLIR